MDIRKCGAFPTRKGPATWFTGTTWQDLVIEAPEPARVRSSMVRFDPGARTHWHTHPLGQTLVVIAGCGRAQSWGGPIQEIRAGDVVWIPPVEKHWHSDGASCHRGSAEWQPRRLARAGNRREIWQLIDPAGSAHAGCQSGRMDRF